MRLKSSNGRGGYGSFREFSVDQHRQTAAALRIANHMRIVHGKGQEPRLAFCQCSVDR